ncbi:hypothetical protein BKA69DRAFT_1073807 [Paraphysoderma sedebokerense]|nr:hypothetical protein BKA69DRAFT_1073807 [Paraphysoderma sedebokerense]
MTSSYIDRRPNASAGFCVKCKDEKGTITIRQILYCRSCFIENISYKFRHTLARLKTMNHIGEDKLLLALSGGHSSRTMLHLMSMYQQTGESMKTSKCFKDVIVCHIDESGLFDGPNETSSKLEEIVASYRLPLEKVQLEEVFALDEMKDDAYLLKVTGDDMYLAKQDQPLQSNREKLQNLFLNSAKMSGKEDLLNHLKMKLLLLKAKSLGCSRLMLGDSGTRLAIKIISETSKGRGYSLPVDIAGETDWYQDVIVLRPMKDYILKELGIYNTLNNLETIHIPTFTTKTTKSKASIDHITEEFIMGLERDFSNTVSTVYRTASKLKPSRTIQNKSDQACSVCSGPIQSNMSTWYARHTLYNLQFQAQTSPHNHREQPEPSHSLTPHICYSCQTIMRDLVPPNPNLSVSETTVETGKAVILPDYVVADVLQKSRKMSETEMKNIVDEFLIND